MPGGADFIVGLEVQPRGAGLRQAAAQTKVLTDETRRSGEENRRVRTTVTDLEQAERRRRATLDQVVQSIKAQNLALAQARTDIAQYQRQVEQAAEAKRRATGVFNSFRAAVVAVQIAVAALGLGALIRDSVGVALAFDRANKSLIAAAGSQQLAGRETAFVSAEADRLGLVLTDTAQSYAKLAAASRGTSLAGQETREIFSAVAETGSVLGLRADEMQGALNAVQQMMSKGTVQAEELRGQLGERIPGAFQIAARAMGVTTAELGKMLEGGKVMAADLLPKLADELRKTFGPGLVNAVNSAQANLNRLRNAVDQVKGAVGEGFLAGFLAGFTDLKEALSAEELKAAARDLGESIGKALRTAADIGMLLVKNLELVKAILTVILSLKVAAWFVGLAGAIATATGQTLIFKGALSSLAVAGPLAAIGAALLAVIIVMERYISTTRAAHAAEMEKITRSQEVFQYYQTLKANKTGLTEAEAAYALEVRKTMEAELAATRISLARTRAQFEASKTLNPFKYAQVAGPGRNVLREQVAEQERELKTIENQLNILDSQWDRLGKLPTIKLPIETGEVDKAAKKVADLLSNFRRTAEQAERIRAAQESGGDSEVARVTAEIERQNASYQALHSIEGLSASSKAKLTGIIEALVGRTQDATRATAENAAETQRSLTFTASAAEAEARLADAMTQTSAASREVAIQAEADAVAREHQRESDSAYVAGLLQVIRTRHDFLDTIALEIAAVERQIAHTATLRQKQAELADAQEEGTSATRRLAVELEAETEARARGVQVGTIWHQLLLAISAARAQEIAVTDQQTAVQRRLNDAMAAQRQTRAEFTDWASQRDAARQYGSEIADILGSYGLLSEATRDLAIQEEALAQFREAGNTRTLEQIEAELQGYAAVEESLARVAAAMEMQQYVIQPGIDALKQMGQTLQTQVIDRVIDGNLEFEDLWKNMARTFLHAVAEMLKRWILAHKAMQAEAIKTGAINAAAAQAGGGAGGFGNAGGGTGAMGSLFSMGSQYMAGGSAGAGGAGMSTAASLGAVVAIYAAVYFAASAWVKSHKVHMAEVTFMLQQDVGGLVSNIHGNAANTRAITKQVTDAGKAVVEWIRSLGGEVETVVGTAAAQLTVGRKGQGKGTQWYVQVAGRVKEWFSSQEEAFSFAMVEALRRAEFSGLDPIVVAAIKRNTFRSLEELQQGIADAVKVASFGKTGVEAEFRAGTAEMDRLRASMREMIGTGAELADALNRINDQELLLVQSQRDAITGRKRTAEEEYQMNLLRARVWNAEREVRLQTIAAQILETKARIANYNSTLALIGRPGGGDGGGGGLLGLGRAILWTANVVASATEVITGSGDAGLDALKAYLASLQDLYDALKAMPPIDPSEVPKPGDAKGGRGGGGGDRKQGRLDLLEEVRGWKLSDLQRELQAAGQWFADFKERLKDLGFSAKKQAELLAAAKEELERQRQEIKATQVNASRDFINAGTAAGGPLITALNANRDSQLKLQQANRDLQKEGLLSRKEMRELNIAIHQAGIRQRDQMIGSAADQLFLDLYQLLGDEEAAAQLRYELTLAELDLRREELRLAMLAAGYTQERMAAILEPLGVLIQRVKDAGPALFGPGAPPPGGDDGGVYNPPSSADYWDKVLGAIERVKELRRSVASTDPFEVERLELEAEFARLREVLTPFGDQIKELDLAYAEVMADLARRKKERDDELLRPYEDLALDPFQRELQALEREFAKIRETVGDTERVQAAYALALQDLMKQYSEGLRTWYQELTSGPASGKPLDQQYSDAMAEYQRLLLLIQGGDLSKMAEFEAVGRRLQEMAGQLWGTSTGGMAELRALLKKDMENIFALIDSGQIIPKVSGGTDEPPKETTQKDMLAALLKTAESVEAQRMSHETLVTETNFLLGQILVIQGDIAKSALASNFSNENRAVGSPSPFAVAPAPSGGRTSASGGGEDPERSVRATKEVASTVDISGRRLERRLDRVITLLERIAEKEGGLLVPPQTYGEAG